MTTTTTTEPCLICGTYIETGKDCPECQLAELLNPDTRQDTRNEMLSDLDRQINTKRKRIRKTSKTIQEEQNHTFLDQQERMFNSREDGRQQQVQRLRDEIDVLVALKCDLKQASEMHEYKEAVKSMYQLF